MGKRCGQLKPARSESSRHTVALSRRASTLIEQFVMASTRTSVVINSLVDPLEPISRVDLTDEVVRRFKLLLQQRKLRPGSRIPPERELATTLGISRPSLRHGLKALELMGTIESRRRHGTFVTESPDRVLDGPLDFAVLLGDIEFDKVFEVRKIVEVELAAFAATRATMAELEAISDCLEHQQTTVGFQEEWLQADIGFHNSIAAAAHNPLFTLLLAAIRRLVLHNMRATFQVASPERLSETFPEHLAILRSLRSRDAAGARDAMTHHLDHVFVLWQDAHR